MTTQHNISVSFNTSVTRSPRVLEVGEAFGLGLTDKEFVVYDQFKFETRQGDRLYITGQSGSGKSIILRELQKDFVKAGLNVINIDDIELKEEPLIDQVGGSTEEACRLLSQAGLNDAYLFIRKPSELSDGQRYRFRIAKLMEMDADVWIADEFGAVLDRVTAKNVAFCVRKAAEKMNRTVAVATTHKDLRSDLGATLVIDKRFACQVKVDYTDMDEMELY